MSSSLRSSLFSLVLVTGACVSDNTEGAAPGTTWSLHASDDRSTAAIDNGELALTIRSTADVGGKVGVEETLPAGDFALRFENIALSSTDGSIRAFATMGSTGMTATASLGFFNGIEVRSLNVGDEPEIRPETVAAPRTTTISIRRTGEAVDAVIGDQSVSNATFGSAEVTFGLELTTSSAAGVGTSARITRRAINGAASTFSNDTIE